MSSKVCLLAALVVATSACRAVDAQDWPQWRGPNRDGRVAGFTAPASWPKELVRKWRVKVGDGVATPSLVGDKLYVFARQDGNEVFRTLEAATGNELSQEKYPAAAATGGASGFPGPRCSPTVVGDKVVTLGVSGTLTCWDAASGKVVWRKDDYRGSVPQFYTSSSPIVVDGLCIVQVGSGGGRFGSGGGSRGGIVAYDLASGEEKWKWMEDGPAYASPVLASLGDAKAVVAVTAGKLVALGAGDGKLLWQINYSQGRYNSTSPIVQGKMLIYAGPGRGITSETVDKQDEKLVAKEKWRNEDNSLAFNTPVLRDGLIFGLSNLNSLFCVDAESGKSLWNSPLGGRGGGETPTRPESVRPEGGQPEGGPRRPGGGRRGGGAGYGSVVDAGSVLFALSPTGQLVVFELDAKEFKQLASYKVADGGTYAYPVVTSKGVYIKDKEAVTLWTFE